MNDEESRLLVERLEDERRSFIRMHASRIDAANAARIGSDTGQDGVILDAERVWELARELWDAKPEDC